jgi:two-component system response regulator AtoC
MERGDPLNESTGACNQRERGRRSFSIKEARTTHRFDRVSLSKHLHRVRLTGPLYESYLRFDTSLAQMFVNRVDRVGTALAHLRAQMANGGHANEAPAPLSSFPARIMVVEDAFTTREMLSRLLVARGYRVAVVGADDAPRRIRGERPDAVLLNLVGTGGLDVAAACRAVDTRVPLVVVSDAEIAPGAPTTDAALIVRPFEERQVEEALTRALGPLIRPDIMPARRTDAANAASGLLGESARMAEVRRLIERVAASDVTVLICGESGTGKEVTARALRLGSRRRDRAFVKVNCAALPGDLLESELFGHERGAFTGALQAKPGRFELADRGTIFLDEIGEMSPLLQAKLLQVLQDGEFSRLGGAVDMHVDARVIAATNRDLKRAVADGHFREDLFFRLNVVRITLPPLRDHKDDIPLLIDHFLEQHASLQTVHGTIRLSAETRRLCLEYDWPGNVRELENLVKRLLVLGSDMAVQRELRESIDDSLGLPPAAEPEEENGGSNEPLPFPSNSLKDIGRSAAREAERAAILAILERTRWNRKEAAALLGISYKALLYKIKDNHLDDAS